MTDDTGADAARPNGLYFHTGNSGYTFQVEDNGQGPELVVSGSVFGHRMLRSQMFTTASGLAALGAFLVEQSKRDFSAPYCLVAEEPTPVMASGTAIAAVTDIKFAQRLGSVSRLTDLLEKDRNK